MPFSVTESDVEELIRKFSRLVRAVAAKAAGPAAPPLAADAEEQVFRNLLNQLNRDQSIDHCAADVYQGAVRETVRLLGAGRQGLEHLDLGLWDRLALNQLTSAERHRGLDHARSCEDCARLWHGVSTLKEEAEARKLILASGTRPWWRAPLVLFVVAALIGLAVAAFFLTLQTDR